MSEVTEKLFQDKVVQIAKMNGWLTFHPTPHRVGDTWRSDGRGFPDLVLAHPERGVIFAELKTDNGRLTHWQLQWGETLRKQNKEYYVWRPHQLQLIATRLGGPKIPDGLKGE